ncbi:helicase-related protein [Candidatus Vampirococcus lugosii]|uniref:UvrABC system protein B n=1 Tax=Candidatus Vampirococcus lugosii TaxID=2789015 RepID=A0ABS5QJE9_9BACT|nr:helicase-related protein [Candidatus Vampirococcus lugosii]MBS8121430.1 excinuclease ABC subunit B [Candidatus Vampirococcus lugosii]
MENLKDFLQVSNIQNAQKQPEFIDHLFSKIDYHISKDGRVLILTLTKRSAEEITNFFVSKGYKTYYLHSEIDTIDRWDIIKKLKTGQIDILIGINLLREGIDLPEVSFIGILDADKEGFLRSTTSLIQIIGRAARNPNSEVCLYAEQFTASITKSLYETYRRRQIQQEYNLKHGITPQKAISNIKDLNVVKSDDELQNIPIGAKSKMKKLKRMTKKEKDIILKDLKSQLDQAIANRDFESAAIIRDQIKEIEGD